MAITKQDLENFHCFAGERLGTNAPESIGQLVSEWELQRESEAAIADIIESEADLKAGRTHPANEVIDEVRSELGLNP